jgi:hypothetical protein
VPQRRTKQLIRVAVMGGLTKAVAIDPNATEGAQIGVNLLDEDGNLWVPPTPTSATGQIEVRDEDVITAVTAILDFVGSAIQVVDLDGKAVVTVDIDIDDVNGLAAALAALAATLTPVIHTTTGPTYDVTETTGDVTIRCDATAAPITVNLPTAVGNKAKVHVKKIDASANAVIIDGAAAETIDGGATASILVKDASVSLVSDNVNWNIY